MAHITLRCAGGLTRHSRIVRLGMYLRTMNHLERLRGLDFRPYNDILRCAIQAVCNEGLSSSN